MKISEIETRLLFCVHLFIVLIIIIHLVLDLTAVLLASSDAADESFYRAAWTDFELWGRCFNAVSKVELKLPYDSCAIFLSM